MTPDDLDRAEILMYLNTPSLDDNLSVIDTEPTVLYSGDPGDREGVYSRLIFRQLDVQLARSGQLQFVNRLVGIEEKYLLFRPREPVVSVFAQIRCVDIFFTQ